MRAEIIAIGTELLLGEITDTDSAFLAGQLPALGIDLYWVSQVGDNKDRLLEVLRRAWQRSELILTSGGLGPTEDDITREAIAGMLGEELVLAPSLESRLRERFTRMGIEMPLSNLKQARLIPSAEPLANASGTAPGWWVTREGRILVAMPGPATELQDMWRKEIQPRLQKMATAVILSRTLKTAGLSEAAVGEMVSYFFSSSNPTLGIYARADGIHLRITAKADTREQAEAMIAGQEAGIREILSGYIWGVDSQGLEEVIGRLLVEKKLTLAVAEDYGAGWLAARIADAPESRSFFKGGLVAVNDESKIAFGVSSGVLSRHGAASAEAAKAMAEAVREQLGADIGIAVGAAAETETGASGVVHIALTGAGGTRVISGVRNRQRVVNTALFELRKLLLTL